MPGIPDNAAQGLLLPTSIVYDVESQGSIEVNSREFKDFLVQLRNSINIINLTINKKVDGNYTLEERLSCRYVFRRDGTVSKSKSERPGYRKVVYTNDGIGLPAGAKNIPHGLDMSRGALTFLSVSGMANDTANRLYYTLPYFYSPADYIGLAINGTNIVLNSSANRPTIGPVYIVLEYLKY